MKTLKVMVMAEIRVDSDDDETVRTALKDTLTESIENDELDYVVDGTEEEEDF